MTRLIIYALVFLLIVPSISYASESVETAQSIIEGKIKSEIKNKVFDAISDNYLKLSKHYDDLSKKAFSKFGSANKISSKKTRQVIQSFFSKKSKYYGNAGRQFKQKSKFVKKFVKKIPIVTIIDTAYYEKLLLDDIEEIEKISGIKIDRTHGEVGFKFVRTALNSITFGIAEVGKIKYEIHDEAPLNNSENMVRWAKSMEESAPLYTSYDVKYLNGKIYSPPKGILQYLKSKYKAEKEVMEELGITDYINPDLEWTNDWELVYGGGKGIQGKVIYAPTLTSEASENQINKWNYSSDTTDSDLTDQTNVDIADNQSPAPDDESDTTPGDDDLAISPFLGYVAGKASGSASLFTSNLRTGNNGDDTIRRGSTNTLYSDGINPDIQVQVDSSISEDGYSYSDWGEWNGAGKTLPTLSNAQAERGFWVIGEATHRDNLPTGTATYNGEVQGIGFNGETIGGSVSLNANFGTQTLNGSLDLTRQNGSNWIKLETGDMSYTTGNEYGITFSSTNASVKTPAGATIGGAGANTSGMFVGPEGEGVIGDWAVWNVPDEVGGADGVYRAKK